VSVLIHELGHSVVAKGFGLSVPRITLFIFGGVSQIASEPFSAAVEFWVAVVGPLTSFVLAGIFWELAPHLAWSPPLFALAKYLTFINVILGVFNLIPGFPLDGGRVLRAIVWRITGKYQRATAIAATTGRFFGFVLIFLGVWQVLGGSLINGLWIAFIGWFLESAAGSQLQQEVLRSLLGDHKVLDAMKRDFLQVPGNFPIQEIIDKHILSGGSRCLFVSSNGSPAGMLTIAEIGKVPRSAWETTPASQAMIPMQKLFTTRPDAGLWSALEEMGRDGVNQLPVIDGRGQVVGIVSRDDVLHYLRVLRALAR
jgi:Zn-dependent protease/CBS domain-containing protein